jgi:hypothetical protein
VKLADLGVGLMKPIGKRLITKAGVPAGKAAEAKYGVIGLTIGFDQPTGDTSKSTPPMPKYKTIPGHTQGAM